MADRPRDTAAIVPTASYWHILALKTVPCAALQEALKAMPKTQTAKSTSPERIEVTEEYKEPERLPARQTQKQRVKLKPWQRAAAIILGLR